MGATNSQISEMFGEIADLLDLKQANPFRIRAYRNAARLIERLPRQASDLLAEGKDLADLPGIGRDLADKIREMALHGNLQFFEEFRHGPEAHLIQLLHVPSLGPSRVRLLRDELGIDSLEKLEAAARKGLLSTLPGFGPALQAKILSHIGANKKKRISWNKAALWEKRMRRHLRGSPGLKHLAAVGSFRRRVKKVGDLDWLACSTAPSLLVERFLQFEDAAETVSSGEAMAILKLQDGFQMDLKLVPWQSWGAAMIHFTGSKGHNIHLRGLARRRGLKLNEYGLFRGRHPLAGEDERQVYAALNLAWIEPQQRENSGEIELAAARFRTGVG
jgi:DNA polymerase (family 10)